MRLYFKTWHILIFFLYWEIDALVALGILTSCVIHWPFYFTWTIYIFFLFVFFMGFDKRIMYVCGDIMGPRLWEIFQGLLARHHAQLLISFGGLGFFSMEDCAPFVFLGSWILVAPYLCFKFHIFNRLVLEEYVSQVEGGSHLLQSCLCVTWYGLPFIVSEMHLSFESLVVIDAPSLYTSLMDIHYDTSLKFILEDDFISSTSRTRIHFCLGKRARLWLVAMPYICSFHIAHSIFTWTLCFCFN
jgi:hypothetical protein